MRMLFIHGAGGYVEDRVLATGLGARLWCAVDMPSISEEDMSLEAWSVPVRRHLAALGPSDVVVGHSFGATVLQWVLPEQEWAPVRALLLATPDWSPSGWDVAQYVPGGTEPSLAVSLHHCRDDDVVPFDHLGLNATRAPSADVVEHQQGGHQFEGLDAVLAADAVRPA